MTANNDLKRGRRPAPHRAWRERSNQWSRRLHAAPLAAAASAIALATSSQPAELRKITGEASEVAGQLRSLQGVNGAPAPGFHKAVGCAFGGWIVPEEYDATAE